MTIKNIWLYDGKYRPHIYLDRVNTQVISLSDLSKVHGDRIQHNDNYYKYVPTKEETANNKIILNKVARGDYKKEKRLKELREARDAKAKVMSDQYKIKKKISKYKRQFREKREAHDREVVENTRRITDMDYMPLWEIANMFTDDEERH